MLDVERECLGYIRLPIGHCLAWETKHEVNANVVETNRLCSPDSSNGLCSRVAAMECLQQCVVEVLYAYAQPVNAQDAQVVQTSP